MSRPGLLRDKVQIQVRTPSKDAAGAPTESWATITNGTVWARILPLRGKELIAAQQQQGQVDTKIVIRYSTDVAGIDHQHRILWGSRVYAIMSPPINVRERGRYIELMCQEGPLDA